MWMTEQNVLWMNAQLLLRMTARCGWQNNMYYGSMRDKMRSKCVQDICRVQHMCNYMTELLRMTTNILSVTTTDAKLRMTARNVLMTIANTVMRMTTRHACFATEWTKNRTLVPFPSNVFKWFAANGSVQQTSFSSIAGFMPTCIFSMLTYPWVRHR